MCKLMSAFISNKTCILICYRVNTVQHYAMNKQISLSGESLEEMTIQHFDDEGAPFVKNFFRASSSGVKRPQSLVSRKVHRLDLGPVLTGMALSSVRMHRYSPRTAISAMQAILTSHQDRAAGRCALQIQQPIIWKKCTVTVKSRHCFPRRMKNHRPRALQDWLDREKYCNQSCLFMFQTRFVSVQIASASL